MSFFLGVLVVTLLCIILSSSTWIPEQRNQNLPFIDIGRPNTIQHESINDNSHHFQQEQPNAHQSESLDKQQLEQLNNARNSWDGLPLAKDGDVPAQIPNGIPMQVDMISQESVTTLSPKISSTTPSSKLQDLKSRIGEQTKENIRSIISLDPVIPLVPKNRKLKVSDSVVDSERETLRYMKFTGPTNPKQKAVVDAFLHAWYGYRNYSWGFDHLQPISGKGQNWFGLGLTLIDSLDTLYIMGLQKEFFAARDWVEDSLSVDVEKTVNLFETTIRVLGGLLSAYHLSGDKIFKQKAEDLGSRLFVAFNTPSGVPYSDVNLRLRKAHGPKWNPDSTTSEVSTIQLEFRDLSRITGNPSFENAAMNVSHILHKQSKTNGLVPIYISSKDGILRANSVITLGARGDSYYEYLLKQWIQTGKKISFLRDDYMEAIEGIRDKLMRRTPFSNLTYIGELESNGAVRSKMDHLVCYLPGTLALGYFHGFPKWHLDFAKDLLYTCYLTYIRQPTGLAPEITYFHTDVDKTGDFYVKSNDAHNLLRPETVESLYYLHQITGEQKYVDWGWEIFGSFMEHTKVAYGFTSISSVLDIYDKRPRDMMESFFLGETLKYFYLLFSDSSIFDFNTVVFNTEAHVLPVYDH